MYSVNNIANVVHDHVSQIFGNQNPDLESSLSDRPNAAPSKLGIVATAQPSIRTVIVSICVVAPIYGAVMGSYGWLAGHRSLMEQLPQVIYSALKMPLLILVTLAICIPSFFVFNSVAGLRNDFSVALNSIISSLASFSIVLFSLAPFTCIFYVSCSTHGVSYRFATLFNALLFGISAISSQLVLLKSYQRLISKNSRHRTMLATWVIVFAFVGVQFGWTLRPFIGNPTQAITFVRDEPMSNAYIQLINITRSAFEEMSF